MGNDHNKPNQDGDPAFRRLTPDEIAELRRESAEAGAWMKAELARRKKESNKR